MGARIYLPILGRFLQVDPVEGGTDNNYVYANDPVNEFDLDGRAIPILFLFGNVARIAAPHIARAAVKYIAKPVAKFAAKRAVPLLKKGAGHVARWGVNGAKKAWSGVRAFGREAVYVANHNNYLRIGRHKGVFRIATGPSRHYYKNQIGRGHKISRHIHIEWRKILYQNHKRNVTKCWGKKCWQ